MSLPAIGVVIPCYKAEHTLRQTVESVLQDAPDNLQLVLVEDGSRARDPAGMTAGEQLKAVTARVHRMVRDLGSAEPL